MKAKILLLGTALLAAGCSYLDVKPYQDHEKPFMKEKLGFQYRPESYLRPVSQREILGRTTIHYSSADVPLIEAISANLPEYNIVPMDASVDLGLRINVSANQMSMPDYLDYLSSITGYNIDVRGRIIEVASRVTKEWNLATLSGLRSFDVTVGQAINGISGVEETGNDDDTEAKINVKSDDIDAWTDMLTGARAILGAPQENTAETQSADAAVRARLLAASAAPASADESASLKPYVVGVRSLGTVTASGLPGRMKILDEYLSNIERSSSKQVNIDIKIFDVTLDDDRGAGINWKVDVGSMNKERFTLATPLPPAFFDQDVLRPEVFNLGFMYDDKFEANLRFLSSYGEVELVNEPNVTTLNGSTAYLASGDEFSFVSDFEVNQDQNGNVFVTPEFSRIKIGISFTVTPRVLKDDRVLLDIVPVVSELNAFDPFTVNLGRDRFNNEVTFTFETPNVALDELATQVIARSGQTLLLGGLMTKKITDSIEGLPLHEGGFKRLLGKLFESVNHRVEKKELVLMITPTLVEDSQWSVTRN